MSEAIDAPWYEIDIPSYQESSGVLSVLEYDAQIPFIVKRVFWVHSVPDLKIERGGHAHAELDQVIFCAQGCCRLMLESKNGDSQTFDLSRKSPAIYVSGKVWRSMNNFSTDCSLMVLCDRPYSEDRVISDYNEFLNL